MKYNIEFKPKTSKDLKQIPKRDIKRILQKIEAMSDDLSGDVKKLTNYTPEYRLRCGDYRILFELDKKSIIIYRILNRKGAYK